MIIPPYRIGPSQIAGAGKGLFLAAPVARGAVIIAPDNVHTVWPESRLRALPADSLEVQASVRWFEQWFSITPEWSDECYVNHAFKPTGLWHLGFIFALADLPADTEVTSDYRLLLGDGENPGFVCSQTGQPIIGLPWQLSLQTSARQLLGLFERS
ncbi:SET domain-containing protein [Flagellatimonas centrodinii]|uniref:SET domain-containing protein n=1 Tax=Flagellatimonas centrodinii TaxID=2806210 RepID=UPI001FF04C38|nr:SET domain-containing protein [Flagellatimonas centrodinii]ULQ45500.1 SET domain-containing protein [Flagellatimonas centrodinii]